QPVTASTRARQTFEIHKKLTFLKDRGFGPKKENEEPQRARNTQSFNEVDQSDHSSKRGAIVPRNTFIFCALRALRGSHCFFQVERPVAKEMPRGGVEKGAGGPSPSSNRTGGFSASGRRRASWR